MMEMQTHALLHRCMSIERKRVTIEECDKNRVNVKNPTAAAVRNRTITVTVKNIRRNTLHYWQIHPSRKNPCSHTPHNGPLLPAWHTALPFRFSPLHVSYGQGMTLRERILVRQNPAPATMRFPPGQVAPGGQSIQLSRPSSSETLPLSQLIHWLNPTCGANDPALHGEQDKRSPCPPA